MTVHMAKQVSPGGAIKTACGKVARANWTLRIDAVTCGACLRIVRSAK